jgi:Xaa-Pro aminopeptidase
MTELEQKAGRVEALLAERGLNALLLRRISSFAWYTAGGASYVNTATDLGIASLLLTPKGKYLVTNNIEAPRLEREEKLLEQGYEIKVSPWHETQDMVGRLAQGLELGADTPYPGAVDLSGEIAHLRAALTPEEGERFRTVAQATGQALEAAARRLRPGLSEFQVAAVLAQECYERGVSPIVVLIAADERVRNFRHPISTDKKVERYVMLVVCGRRWGLVASATRLVHFGPLPDELRRKQGACAQVDAAFIAATRPGASLAEVFRAGTAAYARTGFPDEWTLHHQGGSAGYEPREYLGLPTATEVVEPGQVFAWNPSITGVKSEDTILVGKEKNDIITATGDWPTIPVEVGAQVIQRPAILEVR